MGFLEYGGEMLGSMGMLEYGGLLGSMDLLEWGKGRGGALKMKKRI